MFAGIPPPPCSTGPRQRLHRQPAVGLGAPMGPLVPHPGGVGHRGIVMQVPPSPEAMHLIAGGQSAPAVAVAEGFAFVVYGGALCQFTMDRLMEVARTRLVRAEIERVKAERRQE